MFTSYPDFFLGFVIGGLLAWGWGQRRIARLYAELIEFVEHPHSDKPSTGQPLK